MYGLSSEDLAHLIETFKRFPDIKKVLIFGSRAMGNFKKGSDIDLALIGTKEEATASKVSSYLNEESPFPYFFDVIDYQTIVDLPLKEHIDQYGKEIFKA